MAEELHLKDRGGWQNPVDERTLNDSVKLLRSRFGDRVIAAYIKGKTMFRNEIMERQSNLSMLEAEMVIDSLEAHHLISFSKRGSSPPKPLWTLTP